MFSLSELLPSPSEISPIPKPAELIEAYTSFILSVPRTMPVSPSPSCSRALFTRSAPSPAPLLASNSK